MALYHTLTRCHVIKSFFAFICFIATDAQKATQALELLGMILIALALLLAILKRTVMRSQGKLPLVSGILAVCSGRQIVRPFKFV